MEKIISCCGLNCATCDARIATLSNDDELRRTTAAKWKAMYNASELSYDKISCTGCREEGIKFSHCNKCEIRKCVNTKGFNTCGDCAELDFCSIVSGVHQYVPNALENLKNLN